MKIHQQQSCFDKTTKDNVGRFETKGLEGKNYLFQVIDRSIFEIILCKKSSKQIWNSMKKNIMALQE